MAYQAPTGPFQLWSFLAGSMLAVLLMCNAVLAVPMIEDPNGFEGIPWGAALSESETFGKVEDAGRFKTYELKAGSPTLGPAKVDSMKFITIDDKFARVTVRYQGKEAHEKILAWLQTRFGPLDRTPGQFPVGPVKFYAWQGFETEITMRYEAQMDRGIIFFESQILRNKVSEGNSATVF